MFQFVDASTHETITRDLEDSERITDFLPQVTLIADKETVYADGVDFVTVNARLHSVPLSDGKPVDLARVHTLLLMVAETEIRLETDANGFVSHELEFSDTGTYTVCVRNLHSNVLEIEAV